MSVPASREQFKQYCLRELGAPVLEINVDDDQLEDRIDDALEFWNTYHHEGVVKCYLKHQLKRSTLSVSDVSDFEVGGEIVGSQSGATATIIAINTTDNILMLGDVVGEFIPQLPQQDTIDDSASVSHTVNSFTLGEFDSKYIELPDHVYGVTRIIPLSQSDGTMSGSMDSKLFGFEYQFRSSQVWDLADTQIMYYKQVMSHIDLLDHELNAKTSFEFNRLQCRLFPYFDWESDVSPGDYVILDCYRALNPTEFSKVWKEIWFKRYTTALFKKQWGQNLSKFSGIQLPGGVTLDGPAIYSQAMDEIRDLEEKLILEQPPVEFFMG